MSDIYSAFPDYTDEINDGKSGGLSDREIYNILSNHTSPVGDYSPDISTRANRASRITPTYAPEEYEGELPSRNVIEDLGAATVGGAKDTTEMALRGQRLLQELEFLSDEDIVGNISLRDVGKYATSLIPTVAIGQALDKVTGSEFTTKGIEKLEEADTKYDIFKPSKESQESWIRGAVYGGTRAALPSLTAAAATLPIGGAGGIAAFVSGGAAMFGGAAIDEHIEDAKAENVRRMEAGEDLIDEKTIMKNAMLHGLVKGGLEGVSNAVGTLLFGLGGKALTSGLKSTIKGVLSTPIKKMIVNTIMYFSGDIPIPDFGIVDSTVLMISGYFLGIQLKYPAANFL